MSFLPRRSFNAPLKPQTFHQTPTPSLQCHGCKDERPEAYQYPGWATRLWTTSSIPRGLSVPLRLWQVNFSPISPCRLPPPEIGTWFPSPQTPRRRNSPAEEHRTLDAPPKHRHRCIAGALPGIGEHKNEATRADGAPTRRPLYRQKVGRRRCQYPLVEITVHDTLFGHCRVVPFRPKTPATLLKGYIPQTEIIEMGIVEKFLPKEDRYAAMLLYGMVFATCFNGIVLPLPD